MTLRESGGHENWGNAFRVTSDVGCCLVAADRGWNNHAKRIQPVNVGFGWCRAKKLVRSVQDALAPTDAVLPCSDEKYDKRGQQVERLCFQPPRPGALDDKGIAVCFEMNGHAHVEDDDGGRDPLRRQPTDRIPVFIWFHPQTARHAVHDPGVQVSLWTRSERQNAGCTGRQGRE